MSLPIVPSSRLEGWLQAASKLILLVPPVALLIVWLLFRVAHVVSSQFVEDVFAVTLYGPPLVGLPILIVTLLARRGRGAGSRSRESFYSLIYAALAVVSPLWLFVLFLIITGFNR